MPGFSAGIARALGAIEATQDADGLTWAKPGYPVKYLVDQSETYAGLVAAGELGRMLASQRYRPGRSWAWPKLSTTLVRGSGPMRPVPKGW